MATSRIAEQVGRVLGDRYRLLRPLGTGASAHVYVAEDVSLRRRVAIKVLHPALADDEAFLRRFRAEARVVAALRHPNILRVYDWGEDSGSPYLVTELLEGGSLRSMLDEGNLLTPAQAASVGAGVARALAHAHRRGLIHRDVKPANLLFDEEGSVSVADFGLARALAEASWTEPAGAVLGTARYAAPEQVRGQVLDDRADVYSLALVLIEAVTGEVPFAADTTIGTLMARVDRSIPVPAQLGPLAAVLHAAGAPAPPDRVDAARLASELEKAAAELPPADPLPLTGPLRGYELEIDPDPTTLAGAGEPPATDPATLEPRTLDLQAFDLQTTGSPGTAPASMLDAGDTAGAALEEAGVRGGTREAPALQLEPVTVPMAVAGRQPRRRRRKWLLVALAAIVAVAAGGGAAAYLLLRPPPLRPVPQLAGDTEAQAASAVAANHLKLTVAGRRYDQNAAAGKVIGQQPAGGKLRQGRPVAVTISLGPPPVAVPSLTNHTKAQAAAALTADHLVLGSVTSQASTTVADGLVISWSDSGATVAQGTRIDVVVSTGLPFVAVPSLSGTAASSFAGAQSALAADSLVASQTQAYSDTIPAGQVIGTNPGPGTQVRIHTTVTVVISKGPDVLPVPDVSGDSVAGATQILSARGFAVSGVSGNPTATVTGTNPPKGTIVHRGSSVELITS